MELRQLSYLVTLAEELHFGRTAVRLQIAQPTLSQEIRKLERELGVLLFDRTPRGARLTEAGEGVVSEARRTLAAADRVVQAAHAAVRAVRGRLRVGFVSATAPPFLPDVVSAFRLGHPEANLELVEFGVDRPSAGLREGSVDIALVWPPVDVPDLHARTLLTIPRVAVLPADHPLAGRAEIGVDELADEPCVSIASDDRHWSDFWLAEAERTKPALRGAQARTLEGVLAVIAAGEGVGLAPDVVARGFAQPRLAFVPVRDIPPATLEVAWHPGRPLPRLARGFLDACLEAARAAGTSA